MIRVCRNLAALCFLLAVTGTPANGFAMQGEPQADCSSVTYSNGDNSVDFSGCTDSCGWLEDHCDWYCGAPPLLFMCFGDGESLTSGFCDCVPPIEGD